MVGCAPRRGPGGQTIPNDTGRSPGREHGHYLPPPRSPSRRRRHRVYQALALTTERGSAMPTTRFTFQGASGATLSGRLDQPADGSPLAYALFSHCFTCSKDLKAVVNISRELNRHRIGIFRFDFTGLGESEGNFEETGFSSNVDDLVAAAEFMARELATPQVLIGHSFGGAAVLQAAHRTLFWRRGSAPGGPSDQRREGRGDDWRAIRSQPRRTPPRARSRRDHVRGRSGRHDCRQAVSHYETVPARSRSPSSSHAEDRDACDSGRPRLDQIDQQLHLEGDLDDTQRQRLMEIADRCPVHQTLDRGVRVATQLASVPLGERDE